MDCMYYSISHGGISNGIARSQQARCNSCAFPLKLQLSITGVISCFYAMRYAARLLIENSTCEIFPQYFTSRYCFLRPFILAWSIWPEYSHGIRVEHYCGFMVPRGMHYCGFVYIHWSIVLNKCARRRGRKRTISLPSCEYLSYICWKFGWDRLSSWWVTALQIPNLGARLYKQARLFGTIQYVTDLSNALCEKKYVYWHHAEVSAFSHFEP